MVSTQAAYAKAGKAYKIAVNFNLGFSRTFGDGIVNPQTNLTFAAGGAGVLTGTYYYTQTFVTALGETSPWAGTATGVALSSQQASLTNIPTGATGTIARRIYRTKAGGPDAKDYYLVATINDNTTTTYTDNLPDASLGGAVNWSDGNRGIITDYAGTVIGRIFPTGCSLGYNNFNVNVGYASVAVGGGLNHVTSGRRNNAFGSFALDNVTTGYENVGIGTHSGQGLNVGGANTFVGVYAGMQNANGGGASSGAQNFNVGVGQGVMSNGTGIGSGNVFVGYRAGYSINSADQVIGIGYFAGQYANASRMMFIDNVARSSLANAQDQGLIYGQGQSTPQTQELRLNARVRLGWDVTLALVANLPAASSSLRGFRAYVVDSNAAYTSANVGATVAGGRSNCVPVFCNGSAWVIG